MQTFESEFSDLGKVAPVPYLVWINDIYLSRRINAVYLFFDETYRLIRYNYIEAYTFRLGNNFKRHSVLSREQSL